MSTKTKKRARVEVPKEPESEPEELETSADYDSGEKTELDAPAMTPEERTAFIRKVIVDELFGDKLWIKDASGKGGYRKYLVAPMFEDDFLLCLIGDTPCDVTPEEFADELKNLVQLGSEHSKKNAQ